MFKLLWIAIIAVTLIQSGATARHVPPRSTSFKLHWRYSTRQEHNLSPNSSYTPSDFELYKFSGFKNPEQSCPSNKRRKDTSHKDKVHLDDIPPFASIATAEAMKLDEFCSHLSNETSYVVLPTTLTPAGFFPNFASMMWECLIGFIKLFFASRSVVQATASENAKTDEMDDDSAPGKAEEDKDTEKQGLLKDCAQAMKDFKVFARNPAGHLKNLIEEKDDVPMTQMKFFIPVLIFDIIQTAVWCYHVFEGVRDPPHVAWLNPSVWYTPAWYCVVALSLGYLWLLWITVPIMVFQTLTIFYQVCVRLTNLHIGAASYELVPSFSVESVFPPDKRDCITLASSPLSQLYTDPYVSDVRKLYTIMYFLTFVPLFIYAGLSSRGQPRKTFIMVTSLYLAVYFVATIWFGFRMKGIGTMMRNEECGLIVIGNPPGIGYAAIQVQKSYGYALYILRTAFGL